MTPVKTPLPPSPEPLPAGRLSVPATMDQLPELRQFVVIQARKAGLETTRLAALDLAVEEAAVNIITHAYPETPGLLEFSCHSDETEFVVELADKGEPFDPTATTDPDTTLPLEERNPGGLGLHLIRRSCDKLSWRRESGRNILTCRFNLDPPAVRERKS
jgi:serine/threonine-protein kinase RsbW